MSERFQSTVAYLALILISLPFPLLHNRIDKLIDDLRPVMKMDDGTYEAMLMPVDLLEIRRMGGLSLVTLTIILAVFGLSLFQQDLRRLSVILFLTLCQLAAITFYASTTILLLLMRII